MAAHKVPQDVEADDKFLGPLSFKQFIFGGLALVCGYLVFFLITKNLAFLSPIFGLPMIVFGFLAFPWSKEQPTELWLAARIRFLLKPRKRIWDQSGMKHLVSITAPKKIVHEFTDGLNQDQVRTRMSALATMVDSRGWAVKNYTQAPDEGTDRLVAGNVSVQSKVAVADQPDVMDENSGQIAKQFESMIERSEQKHKSETKQLIEQVRSQTTANPIAPPTTASNTKNEDFWFMHTAQKPTDPSLATFDAAPVIHPGNPTSSSSQSQTTADAPLDEHALLDKLHEKQKRDALQTSHIKTIDPSTGKVVQTIPETTDVSNQNITNNQKQNTPMTTDVDPDILKYAYNNDLNVETIQRQGHKKDNLPPDEVVVSLH